MRKAIGTIEYEALKHLLRTCRVESGLTQKEVAARLNTTASRISEYETGERRADLVQLSDLCTVYDITLTAFVTRFAEAVENSQAVEGSADPAERAPSHEDTIGVRQRTTRRHGQH